ncbi:hypothetical protein KI688_005488 [Linnemannia hyalina]|uniref:Protein kinase domain-containing protein n=1 Tax=Linnemannia hyalina TaxID=64524 RepID=A0A9P8BNZ2_9FUNG|nr:hypothetical protein KI688_005488 [Linnemannia hyalina]
MTDNFQNLTLFCLVDGEATSNAFSVKVPSSGTVDDLKDVIKTKKAPRFDDVAADELTLWHVEHPVIAANKHQPVLLNAIDSATELDPTDDIVDVFAETPPKKTIHILVQRPPSFVPSPAIGEEQVESSLTEPSMSVPPRSVTPWPGFLESVRGMDLDRTPRYPKPKFRDDRIFRVEEELHEIFAHDINAVGPLTPGTRTRKFNVLQSGKPDLVCRRTQGSADDPQPVMFPIEIKRPIIFDCDDLVVHYNSLPSDPAARRRWKHPLSQTRPTLLQCYLWVIREALHDDWVQDIPSDQELEVFLRKSNPQLDNRGHDNQQYKGRNPVKRIESMLRRKTRSETRGVSDSRVTLPAFEKLELIVYNDDGAQTYRASWQGCNVVVKKCDIWHQPSVVEELKHEATVYQYLEELQGSVIPRLEIAGVSNSLEAVLVTDFRGHDISQGRLEDSDKETIRKALSAIHRLGVLHGDIRPQNILVERDGSIKRFVLIDFGRCEFTTNRKKLQQEADSLNSVLG